MPRSRPLPRRAASAALAESRHGEQAQEENLGRAWIFGTPVFRRRVDQRPATQKQAVPEVWHGNALGFGAPNTIARPVGGPMTSVNGPASPPAPQDEK